MIKKQANIDTETLQLLPVPIILFDSDKVYFLNQKAIDLFQINKTDLNEIGLLNPYSFITEPHKKKVKKIHNQILKGKEFPPIELECTNIKGERFYIETKTNCVYFQGKKVLQSTVVLINDRIEKLEQLEKTNSIIKKFNSNVNDIIFEQSFVPHNHITYISDSVIKILGKTPQEVYENPNIFLDQIDEDDKKNFITSLQSYLKITNNKKISKIVFKYHHPNGKSMYLESAGSPVIQNKKVVGVVGVIRDITRKQTNEELINQKWTNYKNLIETSPIGILIHQGFCFYANKTAATILEISNPNKLIGKHLLDFIIPEQKDFAINRVKHALEGNVQENRIYTIKTVKGNFKEVELKTVPFIFDQKPCVQTIISDISTEKKLEDEKLRTRLAESTNNVLVRVINQRKVAEAKLDAIFNTTSHIIWTIDKDFKLSSFNKNYYNQISTFYNEEVKAGIDLKKLYKSFLNTKDYYLWINQYKKAFNGENILFETQKRISSTEVIYREIYLNPIYNDKEEIVEVAAISHNITARKKQEEEIQKQAAKLKAIFESGNQLLWTVNKEFLFTSFNKNFIDAMTHLYNIKPNLHTLYQPHKTKKGLEHHDFWILKYKEVFETKKSVEFTTEQSDKKNNKYYRQIFLHPIFNTNSTVNEISCTSNDITELKYLQHQAANQSARLKSIFESGNQLMWTITNDFKLTSFNQNYASAIFDLYHFYPEIGKSIREISGKKTTPYEPLWDEKYQLAFNGEQVEFTTQRIKSNGAEVHRQYYLYPIKDNNDKVIEVSGLGFDVTENKLNEFKLKQSLKEKEVLLKEVHHRVKNNMQVISSILNLQSTYVNDEYALNLLKESQNRIKSMSFIHESLYQTKNFELVNFSDYLVTLSKNLIQSYSVNTNKIKLELQLDKLFLNLDVSIPCGLIINEIISNSLKYAFPDNKSGTIFLNLTENNKTVCLKIGDNGVGIPKHIDIKNTATLGLQLVDTLVEQINGTLTLNRTTGTKFKLEFKIP